MALWALMLVVFLASCLSPRSPLRPRPSPSQQTQAAPVGARSPSPAVEQAAASAVAGGSRSGAPSTAPSPAAATSSLASASPALAASPSTASASPVAAGPAQLPAVPFESGSADRGQATFTRAGCIGCHTANVPGGTIGPNLNGVATRAVDRAAMLGLPGPREYFVQSIVTPLDYVVEGFAPVMLDWKQMRLTEQDLADLAAFLGTLSAP